MSAVSFFDANCRTGLFKQSVPGFFDDVPTLLERMDRFGIAEALVLDTMSHEGHPADGNARIVETTAPHPRLHPAWGLLPLRGGEMGPAETLMERMEVAGVRAVWLFPEIYRLSLEDWCLGDLFAMLAAARVPLFINPNAEILGGWPPDSTPWGDLVRLCRDYPTLPVVATENRFRSGNRMMYQALAAVENLHIETSGLWAHHGIEFICREFGAHRLLFGSRLPFNDAGAHVMQVSEADIADEDKRLIAGDNLRRLMGEAFGGASLHAAAAPAAAADGSLRSAARTNLRETLRGEVIYDSHAHLGRAKWYHIADGDPAAVAVEMERFSIRASLVFSLEGVVSDMVFGNDVIHRAMQQFPGRYYGLCCVNLNDREKMLKELKRCADLGFYGVKLIGSYQNYPLDGPNVVEACRFANERGMVVLNHSWGEVDFLRKMAQMFPEVSFIIGHMAYSYGDVMRRCPNVYQCTCAAPSANLIEQAVAANPPEQILFGSDITDLPIPLNLGPILYAEIDDEIKRGIMGLNAERLFRTLKPGGRLT